MRLRLLVFGLLASGWAAAGGAGVPIALLGTTADVTASPLCRAGCRLFFEGPEMASALTRKYRLPGNNELVVDLDPHSHVLTNARLMFGINPRLIFGGGAITPKRRDLARQFLEQMTGRRFSTAGLKACFAQARSTDLEQQNAVLSHWTTPANYPYKARCGAGFTAGVWLGYMQQ